ALVAVPAQLPSDHDVHAAAGAPERAHRDRRRAERPRNTRDCAGMAAAGEQLERPGHLELGVRGHGVDATRLVWDRRHLRLAVPTGRRMRMAAVLEPRT